MCMLFQTVFIRSVERNAANVYEARRRILDLGSETLPTVCQSDEQLGHSTAHVSSARQLSSPLSSGKILFLVNRTGKFAFC